MKRALATLFLSVLISACAGVSPTSLKPVLDDRSLELKTVQYDEYYKISGNRFRYTIAAGRYVARFQDASGLYFEGPGECFAIAVQSDGKVPYLPQNYRCGIFVPYNSAAEPKLYFYRDPAVSAAVFGGKKVEVVDEKGVPSSSPGAQTGGAIGFGLVKAFDAAELKNLHFYQDQPKPGQLRSAMQ